MDLVSVVLVSQVNPHEILFGTFFLGISTLFVVGFIIFKHSVVSRVFFLGGGG
jgi:hypothetical protein